MRRLFLLAVLLSTAGCGAVLTRQGQYRLFIDDDARRTPCVQQADADRAHCESACASSDLMSRRGCERSCASGYERSARECPGVRVLRG